MIGKDYVNGVWRQNVNTGEMLQSILFGELTIYAF